MQGNYGSQSTAVKNVENGEMSSERLDANWQTGKYIVEYELKGKDRAEYGRQLLVNLAKDLTARNGKGFSRSNLVYMRIDMESLF